MIKFFCDICKKETHNIHVTGHYTIRVIEVEGGKHCDSKDLILCEDCRRNLKEFIYKEVSK